MTFATGKVAAARRAAKAKRHASLVPKATGSSAPGYKAIARNQKHMAAIAALGCLICGRPAQAHHVDILTPKNAGPKVSDYFTAPLCPEHHTGDQNNCAHVGERAFWLRNGIDIGAWINKTLCAMYPKGTNEGAERAIEATGGQTVLRDAP